MNYMQSLGWKKLIGSLEWHNLVSIGWPGWDLDTTKEPHYTYLYSTFGKGKQSRDYAIQFDDISQGSFWYRDYTENNLPIIRNGDNYSSRFAFQFKADKDKFEEMVRQDIN